MYIEETNLPDHFFNGWPTKKIRGMYIGGDDWLDRIQRELTIINTLSDTTSKEPKYPPYNIVKFSETENVLELATAGFTKDELKVTQEDGYVVVTGEKAEKPAEHQYEIKQIATRKFEFKRKLAPYSFVRHVVYENGILAIWIERQLPEEKKPKKFEIK